MPDWVLVSVPILVWGAGVYLILAYIPGILAKNIVGIIWGAILIWYLLVYYRFMS